MTALLHPGFQPLIPGEPPLLSLRDLSLHYAGAPRPALDRVSLDVRPGRVLAIVGESGSGKSSLAQAVLGLLPPGLARISGSVRLHDRLPGGEELTALGDRAFSGIRGARIGLIPQEPLASLDPTMRIRHQLHEAIDPSRRRPAPDLAALLRAGGFRDPERVLDSWPHELSGGMCQRILILGVWARGPGLIIADEPTSALDVTIQRQILDLIDEKRRANGTTLVLITHDLGVVADRADDVLVLRHGKVEDYGPRERVLAAPGSDYTRRLLGDTPHLAPRRAAAPQIAPRQDGPAPQILLAAEKLGKGFHTPHGPVRAVIAADLAIAPGEIHALVGESGSGKTTLSRLLAGLSQPGSGRIDWQSGLGLGANPAPREIFRQVQYVHQDSHGALNPLLPVRSALAEPLRRLRGLDRRAAAAEVDTLLTAVGLDPALRARRPSELSGGQRQRVAIARGLAAGARLLILDEPFSALDVTTQKQVAGLLRDLVRRSGVALLIVSHDLALMAELADRVSVMQAGRILEAGPVAEILAHPRTDYTRRLLESIPGRGLAQGDLPR